MPASEFGSEVAISSALNWRPKSALLTHSPRAAISSPGFADGTCPITVTVSATPLTETRSTQYPFSSLWKVTRSTTPSSFASGTSPNYPG